MKKTYKLGYCIYLLTGGTLPQRIEFLYENGFRSVAKLQTTDSARSQECRDAAKLIRELGMTLTCHTNVQGQLKNRRMDPDFARRALADDLWWNEASGGAVRNCCSDIVSAQNPREILLDDTVALAEMQLETFRGTGILSGIENAPCPEYCLPEHFAMMKPHSTAMLFDAGHAHISLHTMPQLAGMTLETYLDAIPLPIAEVHITDNHGQKDEHLAPTDGTTDYAALLRGLEKRPETPVISLEYCKDAQNGLFAHDITVPEERSRVLRAMNLLREIFPS